MPKQEKEKWDDPERLKRLDEELKKREGYEPTTKEEFEKLVEKAVKTEPPKPN